MSDVISPKTGRTIKVGGKTYNDLLKDPEYSNFFASQKQLSSLPKATVSISSPPLSPKTLPPLKSSPIFDDVTQDHLTSVLSMPLYKIPSLEEVLSRTRQPYLRERLQRMIDQGHETNSPTRGWAARAPQKGNDRHQLMKECGSKCFLKPDTEGFPICPKCELGNGACLCQIDLGAVYSSKIRGSQWGYPEVVSKADKIIEYKGLGN